MGSVLENVCSGKRRTLNGNGSIFRVKLFLFLTKDFNELRLLFFRTFLMSRWEN